MAPKFEFPTRPSAEEMASGRLTPERLAQIEAAGKHLKKCGSVAAAAAAVMLSVSSYTRNFSMMAKLAGWTSRLPEDYLIGRETKQGGARLVRRTNVAYDAHWAAKMSSADRATLAKALSQFKGSANDFLAEAARRFLADSRAGRPW